jgi:hypothetical protein
MTWRSQCSYLREKYAIVGFPHSVYASAMAVSTGFLQQLRIGSHRIIKSENFPLSIFCQIHICILDVTGTRRELSGCKVCLLYCDIDILRRSEVNSSWCVYKWTYDCQIYRCISVFELRFICIQFTPIQSIFQWKSTVHDSRLRWFFCKYMTAQVTYTMHFFFSFASYIRSWIPFLKAEPYRLTKLKYICAINDSANKKIVYFLNS